MKLDHQKLFRSDQEGISKNLALAVQALWSTCHRIVPLFFDKIQVSELC